MKKQIAAGVLSLSMVLTPTIPVWAQTPVVVAQDQTTEGGQEAAHTAATLSTDIAEKNFVAGAATEFTVTTKANDDKDTKVKGTYTLDKTEGVSIEYKGADGNWYTLPEEYGVGEGFALIDAAASFRATFSTAGEYTFGITLKKADNTEVCKLENVKVKVKGTQEAPAAAPEEQAKTASTVTLKTVTVEGKTVEYGYREVPAQAADENDTAAQDAQAPEYTWQKDNVFTGLKAETDYAFVVRYAETDELAASPASAELSVTTEAKADQEAAPAKPTAKSVTSTSVTLNNDYGDKAVEYGYYIPTENDNSGTTEGGTTEGGTTEGGTTEGGTTEGGTTEGGTTEGGTTEGGTTEGGTTEGGTTEGGTTEGGTTETPTAPEIIWQESNVFSGLTPNTKYAFVVRYAETAELNASAASAPLEVTTAKRSTSYGGGGGAAASDYVISVVKSDNGSLSVSQPSASAGTTITVTATADKGYKVSAVTATDANGNKLSVKSAGTDKYTFIMPAGKVSVKASFVQEGVNTDAIIMQIGSKTIQAYGKTITNDAYPLIVNNRTMVPIRVVTETLGGTAVWNEAARTVTLVINGKTITMTIDVTLEKYGVAPIIINNRTYVPIRFVAEELGADVRWNETTQQITITK